MKTKKLGFLVAVALLLVFAGFPSQGNAGVNVSVGINLPAFRFPVPPPMVVIPGTYAYFAPEADVDIVFYEGFWYRPYEGRWFRSRGYNGPWGYIATPRVPHVLMELPHDYRHAYREHPRIDHRDFNRHWRSWERNKYWEKDERWRAGKAKEHRKERREDRRKDRRDNRYDDRHGEPMGR